MTPHDHYRMLKSSLYTPTAAPTWENFDDSKAGFFNKHGGEVAGTAVGFIPALVAGASAGAAAGTAASPFTVGASIPVGVAIGTLGAAAGYGIDYFRKRGRFKDATKKWQENERKRENAAIMDGSYYTDRPANPADPVASARAALASLPASANQAPVAAPPPAPTPPPPIK